MSEEKEKSNGIWHHIRAAMRDIIVVTTVLTILGTAAARLTAPYWQPFADLPGTVAEALREIALLRNEIRSTTEPQVVEFNGPALVAGPTRLRQGDTLHVLYFLRRNVSCDTTVFQIFYNVDTNVRIQGAVLNAVRAPVTDEFLLFPLAVAIPPSLPPGRYVYAPQISPEDCGVYGDLAVPPSLPFTVTGAGSP